MLCIVSPDTNATYYGRDPDDASQFSHADGGSSHGVGASAAGETGFMVIPSDASGDVEVIPGGAGSHTMRLIGTLDKTDDGQVLVNAAPISTGSWDTHQITSLASGGGAALLKITQPTGNNKVVSVRPSDLTNASENTRSYVYKRNLWTAAIDLNDCVYVLAVTNATGQIDLRAYGAANYTVTVVCTVDDFILARTEFDSWVTADQNYHSRTTGIGSEAFCSMLTRTTDGTTDHKVYVTPDSGTYSTQINSGLTGVASGYRRFNELTQAIPLFSGCDSGGDVEISIVGTTGKNWAIDLLGYVLSNAAPTITANLPTGGSEDGAVEVSFVTSDDVAVDLTTLDVDFIEDPTGVPIAHPAIVNGVFQGGFSGVVVANATFGYDTAIVNHPLLTPGQWDVDVYVEDMVGAGAALSWSFTVASMALTEWRQSSTKSVDITFDRDPRHLDQKSPIDGTNPSNYVVTGPVAPLVERRIQWIEHIEYGVLRIWFDGDFVPGEQYQIDVSGIVSTNPVYMTPATVLFTAFGAAGVPVPLELETLDAYDIRNPLADRDAPTGAALGQVVLDETGDLDVEARRRYLRKRIFRRLGTRKGAMLHLPDYGLEIDSKRLLKAAELRKLQVDAETQIKNEPGVRAVRVSVRQIRPGLVYLKIKVRDKFGSLDIEGAFGGED